MAPAAELLHRYEFDSGDARDSVGKIDGILEGQPRFVPGRIGSQAIFLNGIDDAVQFNSVELGDCYTIAMWVKPALDGPPSLQALLSYRASDAKDSDILQIFLNRFKTTDGSVGIEVRRPKENLYTTPLSKTDVIVPSIWSAIAITVDCRGPQVTGSGKPSFGTAQTYVNGISVTKDARIAKGLPAQLGLVLGMLKNTGFRFRGAVDDLRIYSGIATPEEISGLAKMPRGADISEDKPAVQIPPEDKILSTLRAGHPRLILTADRLARMQAALKTDAHLQQWFPALQKVGEKDLAAPVSTYAMKGGNLLDTSRDVLGRVLTLGLLYRLTGEDRYADRLWRELEGAAAFPDWHPDHGLDTAEMSAAFALAYDWLYDHWTPDQRATLRTAMVERSLEAGLDVYEGRKPYGWNNVTFNWNQVCNGGVGLTALALADEEPQLSAKALRYALSSLPRALVQFAPGGASVESPAYWGYANHYAVMLICALDDSLGRDFGLTKIDGFDKIGDFPPYVTGPSGLSFNYGDSHPDPMRSSAMLWLASRFHRPDWARFEISLVQPQSWPYDPLALDMIWYDPALLAESNKDWPLDHYFAGAELVSFRSSWTDPNALFLAFKAGDNKANHSHLSNGSFVLDALGFRWANLIGAENYSAPGYFDTNVGRWDYYRARAEGHNTLVINPDKGPDQDPRAEALIQRFSSTPDRPFAITDLSKVYARQADHVLRGFALLGRKQALVQDEIRCKTPGAGEIWWFMTTQKQVTITDDGKTAILAKQGRRLAIQIASPAEARFSVMDAQPLSTSPQPKQSPNREFRKLVIHLTGQSECRIAVVMTPLADQTTAPALPGIFPLTDW